MKLQNRNILIVSNEKWGDVWYSKHNWANELSLNNNTVYFINPPEKWKFSNLFSSKIKATKYAKNLNIINYCNRLPLTRFELIYKINDTIISRDLRQWFSRNNVKEYIFLTFDPYRFSNPKQLKPIISIYFIADKYTIKREKLLIRNADFLITVSPALNILSEVKKTLTLSHGISETEFQPDAEIEINQGYILYIGNIDYRLDYSFIKQALINLPEERFVFIGNINAPLNNSIFEELFVQNKFSNLTYHPAVHFKKLKNYIAKAKVCIAPMNLDVNGNNINHHKLLQYLAQGKPIVAASFKDYESNDILISYRKQEEGILHLKSFVSIAEKNEAIEKRVSFAKKYIYKNLILQIEDFLLKNKI